MPTHVLFPLLFTGACGLWLGVLGASERCPSHLHSTKLGEPTHARPVPCHRHALLPRNTSLGHKNSGPAPVLKESHCEVSRRFALQVSPLFSFGVSGSSREPFGRQRFPDCQPPPLCRTLIRFTNRSRAHQSEVAQSCLTLCDPMDCSLPDFSIHGILQSRILEWVAISFSRRSSRPRD